jgi:hypothetical protein
VEPLQLKLLSVTDEGSLDIDIVGRVPYHQANSVEKTDLSKTSLLSLRLPPSTGCSWDVQCLKSLKSKSMTALTR